MEKNLYIDASHPDETRVVLKENGNIEDYEYETVKNNLIKNNIYLGKVSRVEPSLQAAFIDFGRERHGFLSFNDIQSDYYQIPSSDLDIIKQEEEKFREELAKKSEEEDISVKENDLSTNQERKEISFGDDNNTTHEDINTLNVNELSNTMEQITKLRNDNNETLIDDSSILEIKDDIDRNSLNVETIGGKMPENNDPPILNDIQILV